MKVKSVNLLCFTCILLLPFALVSQSESEMEGKLTIKYAGESQLLNLERFNPETTFLGVFALASTRKWSFEVSPSKFTLIDQPPFAPYRVQNNNLNINYGGNTLGSINYNNGKYNRPATGTADLLPYAYGRFQPPIFQSNNPTIDYGTGNYIITEGATYVDIVFNEAVAEGLVLSVTPHLEPNVNFGGYNQLSQVNIQHLNTTTIRVSLYTPGSNSSRPGGFSFIAYRP